LNNQPMGFYSPATLVKDAQRRGVRFAGVDVQHSDWRCTVEADGTIRLGLCYVRGLRESVGRAIAQALFTVDGAPPPSTRAQRLGSASLPSGASRGPQAQPGARSPEPGAPEICPRCGCDDPSMLETTGSGRLFCNVCACESVSHEPQAPPVARSPQPGARSAPALRFTSIDDLVARTGARRDELAALADIGALNTLGRGDRRTALWQIERAVKPTGELYRQAADAGGADGAPAEPSPLPAMTPAERVEADYAGTGLTIGPHPMLLRRTELAMRGALRAGDLRRVRHGRRVRVAGAVITRQRPGTAKGFVFLTLEDETGLANIIVRPDLFDRDRLAILEQPYLLIDGVLQSQDGVVAIRAERVQGFGVVDAAAGSHDFY
ncbi:MAG: hypothetical protein KGN76_17875, partial [Acidobacteriota bacterium]|nr:hypothetical protein [Acidobacteriota bacterium]